MTLSSLQSLLSFDRLHQDAIVIQPNCHLHGGDVSDLINTKVFSLIAVLGIFHLLRWWIWWRYFSDQRVQKLRYNLSMSCHRVRQLIEDIEYSGSGRALRGSMVRKCPGVNAEMSFGSWLNDVSGREFKTDSTWVALCIIFRKKVFAHL